MVTPSDTARAHSPSEHSAALAEPTSPHRSGQHCVYSSFLLATFQALGLTKCPVPRGRWWGPVDVATVALQHTGQHAATAPGVVGARRAVRRHQRHRPAHPRLVVSICSSVRVDSFSATSSSSQAREPHLRRSDPGFPYPPIDPARRSARVIRHCLCPSSGAVPSAGDLRQLDRGHRRGRLNSGRLGRAGLGCVTRKWTRGWNPSTTLGRRRARGRACYASTFCSQPDRAVHRRISSYAQLGPAAPCGCAARTAL